MEAVKEGKRAATAANESGWDEWWWWGVRGGAERIR